MSDASTVQAPEPEELRELYLITFHHYSRSFYLWLTVVSFLLALFTGVYLKQAELLSELVIYGALAVVAIPIGLFLWRYAENKRTVRELMETAGKRNGENNAKRLMDISSFLKARAVSFFIRVRSFAIIFATFNVMMIAIFYSRENVELMSSQFIYSLAGMSLGVILTPFVLIFHRRQVKKYATQIGDEEATSEEASEE